MDKKSRTSLKKNVTTLRKENQKEKPNKGIRKASIKAELSEWKDSAGKVSQKAKKFIKSQY